MEIPINIKSHIIKQAFKQATKSTYLKARMGAIIFNKKVILSKGTNYSLKSCCKLHPQFQEYKGSIHAEVDAIIKARKDLKGSSILIIRINKQNQFRLAKPCKECMKYLEFVGIKKIYYSINSFPYIKEEKI